MDFSLNAEQKAWQEKARKFGLEVLRPASLKRDRILDPFATWDWDIIKAGSKLGFRTSCVPKAYGGHEIDFVTQALVMAELAKYDSAMSKAFSQCWKWSHLIANNCTEEQKKRFLTPFMADDTFVLGMGSTEHIGGSDNRLPPNNIKSGMRLSAVPDPDGEHWILNGEKAFIANGPVGKLFFLNARTDPNVMMRDGVTTFIVPKDTPGFRIGKVFNKSGWRFYQNAELIFENAKVHKSQILGEVNGAMKRSVGDNSGDMFGDLELAANALGFCDDAVETAIKVAKTRTQGGQPLKEQQHIQLKINKMSMLTEALRSYVLRSAWEHDQKIKGTNAGLVMNYSTFVGQEVTELYLDVCDQPGVELDEHADKLVRDSFIWSHLAGDTVQQIRVAQKILK
jgi:butyryl-CoA dehydrogenase